MWASTLAGQFVGEDGPSDVQLKQRFVNEFVADCVGNWPCPFSGRTFTKAEGTPSWVAVLSLMHGMFEDAYQRFVALMGGTKTPASVPANVGAEQPAPALQDDPGPAAPPEELGDGVDGVHAEAPVGGAAVDDRRATEKEKDKIEQAQYYRASVLKWCKTGNVPVDSYRAAVVLSVVHAPFMAMEFFRSGEACEAQERAKEAAALVAVNGPTAAGGGHDERIRGPLPFFPLFDSYESSNEGKFIENILMLMNE